MDYERTEEPKEVQAPHEQEINRFSHRPISLFLKPMHKGMKEVFFSHKPTMV